MTALEIIMLIIGILCFAASFILSNDESESVGKKVVVNPELTMEHIEQIKAQIDEMVNEHMSMLEESTEASLDKISNTKILEMNEYVDTIMNEISKNHNETVFMYDMLNEKSKELKKLVKEINETQNRVTQADSAIKGDIENLEKLLEEADKTVQSVDIAIKAAYKTKVALEVQQDEETDSVMPDNVITPQIFEQKNASQKEKEEVEDAAYMAKAELEVSMVSNCNEQILTMHARGMSNLEIAKTLNLGMGEVKLVIDLFNKNN